MLSVGAILFHQNFKFNDGGERDKYLIILGKTAHSILVAKTTSKSWRYTFDFGCQLAVHHAFFLPQNSCALTKHTWICFDEFYELQHNELIARMTSGEVFRLANLIPEHTRDIQACALQSDDITSHQENIILASLID